MSLYSTLWQVKWADGKTFEDKFVDTLLKYGYGGQYMSENWLKQPLFIQSFAPSSLVHISNSTDSPKIFLIDDFTIRTQDTNQVQILFSEIYLIHQFQLHEWKINFMSGWTTSELLVFVLCNFSRNVPLYGYYSCYFFACSHTGKSLQMTTLHILVTMLSALVHGKILLFQLQITIWWHHLILLQEHMLIISRCDIYLYSLQLSGGTNHMNTCKVIHTCCANCVCIHC